MTERAWRWGERTGPSIGAALMLAAGVALPAVFFRLPLALAPVLLSAGVLLLLAADARAGALRWWRGPLAVAVLAVVALGLLSATWSPIPARSVQVALKLTALCLAGSLILAGAAMLPPVWRARLGQGLAIGASAVALFVGVDAVTDFGLSLGIARLFGDEPTVVGSHLWGRGPFMLAVLVWPVALGLATAALPHRAGVGLAALALVAVGTGLLFLGATAATLAFYAGAAVAILAYVWPAWTRRLFAAALVLAILVGPPSAHLTVGPDAVASALPETTPESWRHRLMIWAFALERIAEQPVLGWGLDASRAIPGGDAVGGPGDRFAALPLHPHNAALQVWLELGVIGAIALSALAVALARALARRFPAGPAEPVDRRLAHAAALATWASVAMLAGFSFGAWQSWWIAALWVLGALLVALTAPADRG